jgi:hypothetical protein
MPRKATFRRRERPGRITGKGKERVCAPGLPGIEVAAPALQSERDPVDLTVEDQSSQLTLGLSAQFSVNEGSISKSLPSLS